MLSTLGDGEFDGTEFQAALRTLKWKYVCRTAPNLLMTVYGKTLHIGDLAPTLGELLAVRPAWMTAKQYGPVSILVIWEATYDAPLNLVTNMADLNTTLAAYRKLAHIETFFSDQKSRGFQLHRSHLSDPQRLARLLIASCLAYLWLVYLGMCAARWLAETAASAGSLRPKSVSARPAAGGALPQGHHSHSRRLPCAWSSAVQAGTSDPQTYRMIRSYFLYASQE